MSQGHRERVLRSVVGFMAAAGIPHVSIRAAVRTAFGVRSLHSGRWVTVPVRIAPAASNPVGLRVAAHPGIPGERTRHTR
jgi:hypothetical protein